MKKDIIIAGIVSILFIVGLISYNTYVRLEDQKEQAIAEEERIKYWEDRFFFVEKNDDEITFDEAEFKIQLLYFEVTYNKTYSLEELEKAYVDKNDLFYEYMYNFFDWKFAPKEMTYALNNICKQEFGEEYREFIKVSSTQQDLAEDIFREEQKLVVDYYGDSRIMLYKLTSEQQLEFYNLYVDPSYVLDDAMMETDEPFSGWKKMEEHLVVTGIDGDNITLEKETSEGTVLYIGTYTKSIDFAVDDQVYVEFYFYAFGADDKGFNRFQYKYYNIQFEMIEKENCN